MRVGRFSHSPVFTLPNTGHSATYNAMWAQIDEWADAHHMDLDDLEWSISDGAPMQRAIDTDHATALSMDTTTYPRATSTMARIAIATWATMDAMDIRTMTRLNTCKMHHVVCVDRITAHHARSAR